MGAPYIDPSALQELPDYPPDLVELERLLQYWHPSPLQERALVWLEHVACDEGHALPKLGVARLELGKESRPVQDWHLRVGEHHVEWLLLELVEGLRPVQRRVQLVPFGLEEVDQHAGHVRFVVDDQNPLGAEQVPALILPDLGRAGR